MQPAPRRAPLDAPLRIEYPPTLAADAPRRLAAFAYGAPEPGAVAITLPPLHSAGYECWLGADIVRRGTLHDAQWAADEQLLIATWQLDEASYGGIEATAEAVYRRIGALLADGGYPHPIKIWHYFGDINAGIGDDERYRRFCVGRARGLPPGLSLPAATAIGTQTPANVLTVTLIAAREPGLRLENPRQVPAYEYPREYGPASPSFARATLAPWGQLFVSGTAAIIGHQSVHRDDAGAQLRELALNLDALVAHAEQVGGRRLIPQAIKIFVRDAADAAVIDALAAQLFPPGCARLTVRADICRAELKVEVEALYDPA